MPTTLIAGTLKGGLLTQTSYIENYPGVVKADGNAFMDTMIEQTKESGAKILDEHIVSVDLTKWPFVLGAASGAMYRVLALVVATGATPRKLNVPGEDTYWGNGVSSCALCDALFFKGKDVFVIGGGDSAVEEALQLAPHVKSVTMLVRSQRMRAGHSMQEKLRGYPTIKPPLYGIQVTSILGSRSGVTGIEVVHQETNKKEVLPADGVFLAIGHDPNTDLFAGQLSLSDNGHIIVQGRGQATSIPGVFAAGDVEDDHYRQAIVAAGRGAAAAIDAVAWLREQGITEQALMQLAS
jgi:thioredoxin reductase (NADPH)